MKNNLIPTIVCCLCFCALALGLTGCKSNTEQSESTSSEATTQAEEPSQDMETKTQIEETAQVIEDTRLAFEPMDEIVYPYIDVVREYLEAGAEADINSYEFHVQLQAKPITVSWQLSDATAESYKLEISTQKDYSNAEAIEISGNEASYDLKFLLRDTQYYLRLTVPGQDTLCAEMTFKTAYLGPRFLDVGGLYQNCRDLGGYRVGDKTLLCNMIIRGSSPDNCSSAASNTFTAEGQEFLHKTVRIKTQLDLRGSGENCGRTKSSFPKAGYVQVPLTAYAQCFSASQAELYAQAFRVFADPENYPIYFHCAGGADRTGTVAAILLAYLGVSEDEIIQDYVVTSFSPVCASQAARSRENILAVLRGLNVYSGDTLSEKARSYLISIGVTQRELFNIKAIMFGESLEGFVPTVDHGIKSITRYYSTASGDDFVFELVDSIELSEVLLDDRAVEFNQNGRTVTVSSASMASLTDGSHTVTAVFSDGECTSVPLSVNFIDLTGDLQVVKLTEDGEQTTIYIEASTTVFHEINWHFHTRRSTLYPDVEPNIKINGKTIAELNDTTNMSSYTWTMFPGSDDQRHRVPADIYATGNTMKLVLRTEWLADYLDGQELSITLCKGMRYTVNGQSYRVLSDITYRYTNGIWVKVI